MVEDNERTLALMNETGYEIQQDNGQRIYGPPPDWDGPAPKETEVFIGKLPNDVYEYDLVPLFSSCGKIYMLRIMQNFSGLNRGFAFVQYTTPEEADKAIRLLNNVEIRPGEKIGVVKSRNNCRLYIGKLDQTMTREEIKKELEILTEDIVDVIIHKNEVEGLNNRGYAFVDYQTHKAAAKARRKLVPCKIKIRGHEIQVDWATPCHESGDSLSIQTSLLIKNLRPSCKNDELVYYYSLRNKFKIIKFKRLPTQALVSFNSKQEAEFAMRIYSEIKDTNEFNYFAEKDKRVEIVWLKNTMDLTPFSSSVNYPLPKVFPAPQCCQSNYQQHSNHQQRSNHFANHNANHSSDNQSARPNTIGAANNRVQNGTQGKAAIQTNCGYGSSANSSGYQSSSSHHSSPAYSPSGISPTNRCGSPTYPNGLTNGLYQALSKCTGVQRFGQTMKQNGNTTRTPFSQPSALQAPPGFYGGHSAAGKFGARNGSMDGHMFTNRVPIANRQHQPSNNLRDLSANLGPEYNPFSGRLSNPTPRQLAANHQSHRSSGLPYTSTPTGEENPFTANGFGLTSATWSRNRATYNGQSNISQSNIGQSNTGQSNNGQSINGQSNTGFASKSSLNNADDSRRLTNSSLNASYNFGIWQSNQNLDASTNWSKERKIVKRSAFGSSSCETNISEEDSCSLKSDPDSASCSPDGFNCFNPIHSLNLADNFRSLTTENCQRLPVFSNYPVVQQ